MNAEKLFKHMSWANQQIVGKLAQLPNEALDSYAVNPEWTVREIARHICSSATWYGWRLLDKTKLSQGELDALKAKLDATEIPPATAQDIPALLEKMLEAGDRVIVISLYSNTIKVPYLEELNGLREWYWENFPLLNYYS